jgi:electron transfer flavoprotein alpha/beta subunit
MKGAAVIGYATSAEIERKSRVIAVRPLDLTTHLHAATSPALLTVSPNSE